MDEKRALLADSLNKLDNEFLEKINRLIEDRLSSEKIDIGYLADNMCMSKSTLYRKMKALTGLSTNEYVRKIKMQYAERLLLEGRYNVSEIAFRVGINSVVYFRQCFKEEFGGVTFRLSETAVKGTGGNNTMCQLLATALAQSCHRRGSVVPLRWQSSATGMAKTWIYRWEITNL